MEPIGNIPQRNGRKRVVIIGGGFAGIILSRKLDGRKFQVVLIDKYNYHQFQPLFYQVATAGLTANSISFPLRKVFQSKKDFHFRMCEAKRIVPERNILETTIGFIDYDYLVVAAGCTTNFYGNRQLQKNAFTLKSTEEALILRNQILFSLEKAITAPSAEERNKYMNFVIVGGGATGVELAGALAEMKHYAFPKDYPELDFNEMKIYQIEAGSRLLGVFDSNLSANAAENLTQMGVTVKLNTSVIGYEDNKITLSGGETIETATVAWVAGVTGNVIEGLPGDVWMRGRIKVLPDNRVDGFENLFAIGDIALMTSDGRYPKGHPQVAQVAMQQARCLVKNLNSVQKGGPLASFVYKDKGSLATIGRNAAVAEIGALRFKGFPAWVLWCFVHLFSIMGVANKLTIFISWVWSYFTNDQALRLLIRPRYRDVCGCKDEEDENREDDK